MINSNYNFGCLISNNFLQNLKSFTITLNSDNVWIVNNSLDDYFVQYYNTEQSSNGPGAIEYNGLVVYNKQGKNFVILLQNALEQYLTSANYLIFTGPGTLPNLNNLTALSSIPYPQLPTFINGYNGYNIPKGILNTNLTTWTFYIID